MKELQIILILILQSVFLHAQCLSGDCVNGKGTYQSLNRGWKYIGQFTKGNPNGKGKMTFQDGRYYEGEFLNGKFHGQGIMYLDAHVKIKGKWRDGYCVNDTPFVTTKAVPQKSKPVTDSHLQNKKL
jgi:hypothetical protein